VTDTEYEAWIRYTEGFQQLNVAEQKLFEQKLLHQPHYELLIQLGHVTTVENHAEPWQQAGQLFQLLNWHERLTNSRDDR